MFDKISSQQFDSHSVVNTKIALRHCSTQLFSMGVHVVHGKVLTSDARQLTSQAINSFFSVTARAMAILESAMALQGSKHIDEREMYWRAREYKRDK